ncbi:unnamed protein product [Paramecium pentaurelia]|uniref:Uncharacterized protein n=1 Tax=Paramecium pentaurelia TaxID=43138 RepID=A0A8S1W2N7_9CILI|nr:unnamed protein product [Paramecium pentaurelia]
MLSQLCFQKLENFKRAEEFYLYTLEKRPEDPKILIALFKIKNADIRKAMDAKVGYCEILHENQEMKHIFIFQNYQKMVQLKKFIKCDNSLTPQSYSLNKRYLIKCLILKYQESQLEKQNLKFLLEFRDIVFGLAISKEHHVVLFDWLELLPSSCFLLDQVLKYCHYSLEYNIKFLLEQCIILLSNANEGVTYLNYNYYDEKQYNKTTLKAQAFLAFMRIYASQIVQQCGNQFLSVIDKLLQQKKL